MANNLDSWRPLLGWALASAVLLSSFSACHGASATYASPGDAGAGDSAGSTDVAGGASGGSSGGGSLAPSETPEWPMPNAPGLDLPNTASYDDTSTPGVVHDDVTGLDWMQAPGTDLHTRPEANSLCADLTLGSFDDWRVPTFIELVSLFRAVPGADEALAPLYISSVFQADSAYWSTSAVPMHVDLARMVDFSAHECGTSTVCSIGESADPSQALGGAFCVRSTRLPSRNARYTIASDHVTDTRTGLVWLTVPKEKLSATRADAVSACSALGNGARLPSITELLSITVPFLDTTAFKNWDASEYGWSSSAIPAVADSFWVGAIGGGSKAALSTSTNHVSCVH